MTCLARVLLVAFVAQVAHALGDERIEGIVHATKVTHCDATRKGGCAGTLTMVVDAGDKDEALTIRVPLGTPISCDSETVLLQTLAGKTVVVTLLNDGHVARAIQVAEPERCG
jgi:hypothetical protein